MGTTPESGTKVGRVRENDDFARLRGDILPVKPELSNTSELAPAVVGSGLPHVQLTELPHAGGNDDSARSEDLVGSDDLTRASDATGPAGTPEVARLPDFLIGTPSR